MKKIALVFFLMLMQDIVFAQKKEPGYAGVFLTEADLVNNRLFCKINTGQKGYKLEFPPIADWALTIRIVTPDSVHKFKAGSVYGYYDKGSVYRYAPDDGFYVPQDYYRIEEDKGLVIYTSEFNSGSEYFYSVSLTAPIKRLQLKNLKEDFKTFPEFISVATDLNKEGVHGDLAKRDGQGNYIINKIYNQTVKK